MIVVRRTKYRSLFSRNLNTTGRVVAAAAAAAAAATARTYTPGDRALPFMYVLKAKYTLPQHRASNRCYRET